MINETYRPEIIFGPSPANTQLIVLYFQHTAKLVHIDHAKRLRDSLSQVIEMVENADEAPSEARERTTMDYEGVDKGGTTKARERAVRGEEQ